MSVSSILNIAKSALSANQAAIQTISHNIANVDTAGYSRQEAVLEEATPSLTSFGLIGNGVAVQQIKSYLDQNIQNAISAQNSDLQGQMVYKSYSMSIQGILNENNSNLSATITQFFNDWQALSTDPTSTTDKQTVASDGRNLGTVINGMYSDLTALQMQANGDVNSAIGDVNTTLASIASLNQEIVQSQVGTSPANDYVDQRNQLLQTLSGDMNISYFTDKNNMVTVVTSTGKSLVQGNTASQLTLGQDPNTGFTTVSLKDATGNSVDITGEIKGGSIGALITTRDTTINGCISDLNGLAKSIIDNVNYFHGQGSDNAGVPFFQPETANYAKDMSLSDQIQDPSGSIRTENVMASSSTANPTDNDVALRIASLANETLLGGSTMTSKALSATTALDLSGPLVINGVTVNINATDTLTDIADRINTAYAANPSMGVSASLVPSGTGSQLVLTAQAGAGGHISVVDGTLDTSSGTFLKTLTSTVMADPATMAAGLAGSFALDGQAVQVTAGQTLAQIAAAINGTAGVTDAYAVVSTDDTAGYKLTLLSSSTPSSTQPNLSWEQASPSTPIATADSNTLTLPGGVVITFGAGQSLKDVANTINSNKAATGLFAAITQDAAHSGNYELVLYPAANVMPISGAITQGLGLSGATYTDYQAGVVSKAGQAVKSATNLTDYNQNAMTSLQQQQASVSGVSIDEEMSNLIKYENAYQAAARLYTVANSLLSTLMSAVGVTTG